MNQIRLGLAIHNHQPVGNFPWVFEEAYQKAYLPMIEALERHRGVRLALHYSGSLLDWLRDNYPDFTDRISKLVKFGQVEIMSGGYYEPILAILKDADKIGQIEKYNDVIRDEFGYEPTGMWLPERVWEPHLAKPIAEAGIEWTIVDDTHFKMAGLKDQVLFGYYVTEELGYTLKIYPTSKRLRYLIPWATVPEVIDYLRQEARENQPRIAVMGDDGEKFGIWPGTYQYCWEKGWIDQFFTALEENSDWLQTTHLSEYAHQFSALGRVYLPTASYAEMMEWALPAWESYDFSKLYHDLESAGREDVTRFMHGGFWRNFLVKYPEINTMQKKMLRVQGKVYAVPPGEQRDKAMDFLWKSQTNCPYWHGVFGGVYLTHIRSTVFQNLVQAEKIADEVAHGPHHWLVSERKDFDADGLDELMVDGDAMNLYLDLDSGGSLFEWDLRSKNLNLVDVLTRRPESYHKKVLEAAQERSDQEGAQLEQSREDKGAVSIHEAVRSKGTDLQRWLQYDWYRRACLLDHFPAEGTTLEAFAATSYHETGDFVNQPYEAYVERQKGRERVVLSRNGQLERDGRAAPFRVEKVLRLVAGKPELVITYVLTNTGTSAVSGLFGSGWNLNVVGASDMRAACYGEPRLSPEQSQLASSGELSGVTRFGLRNPGLRSRPLLRGERRGKNVALPH
ncbi:MAG: DUF1926 domain-containing protein [Chloroflexi bacterium]|nr:DUF1926 domain-containing protein [Chloroflexota bacterium]